jgi:hypothetical protein
MSDFLDACDESDAVSQLAYVMYFAAVGLGQFANGCVVPGEAYEALEYGARLLRDRAEGLNRGLKGIAAQERPA